MECDLDRIRLLLQRLGDLPCREIGAVPQCEKLLIAFAQGRERAVELELSQRVLFVPRRLELRRFRERKPGFTGSAFDGWIRGKKG